MILKHDGDFYVDYDFEEVMYRFDAATGKRYGKFYGNQEHDVHPECGLYWDAIRFGDEITKEEYEAGK
jgi:hypothetical protein